jgi:cytidylate kinase
LAEKLIIAIDGPAGAGKSTVARLVAARLGFAYIDTGAMYRAVALLALRRGVIGDPAAIEELAALIKITFLADGEVNRVFADGQEITEEIRTPEVSGQASYVSGLAGVRGAMLARQRVLGQGGDVVMDGRDVGTCVFPAAAVKVFLTAGSRERARRRYIELTAKGQAVDLEQLQREMTARDKADSERALAPLKKAPDALEIDSTKLSIWQTADLIIDLARQKGASG